MRKSWINRLSGILMPISQKMLVGASKDAYECARALETTALHKSLQRGCPPKMCKMPMVEACTICTLSCAIQDARLRSSSPSSRYWGGSDLRVAVVRIELRSSTPKYTRHPNIEIIGRRSRCAPFEPSRASANLSFQEGWSLNPVLQSFVETVKYIHCLPMGSIV